MGVRTLLTAVRDRTEDKSYEIWEEADGTIGIWIGGVRTLVAIQVTQDQYAAIPVKDPYVQYNIVG